MYESVLQVLKQQTEMEENIDLLLNRRCELTTNNAEKCEILNTSFTSVFASTVGSQKLGRIFWVDANTDITVEK